MPPPVPSKKPPTYGPETLVAEWHVPPPPDPLFTRRMKHLRWEQAAFIAGSAAVLVLFIVGFRSMHGLIGGSVYLYGVLITWVWTRRPPRSVTHLMDLPPSPGQFPVLITYSVDGAPYGTDAGVVTITNPWITFQGLESNFAFQQYQVETRAVPTGRKTKDKTPVVVLRLAYSSSGHLYTVAIQAYDKVDGVGQGYKKLFYQAAAKCGRLGQPELGTPTLPPLLPQSATVERRLRTRWVTAGLAVAPLLGFLGWVLTQRLGEWWGIPLTYCVVFSAVLAWVSFREFKWAAHLRSLTTQRPLESLAGSSVSSETTHEPDPLPVLTMGVSKTS